MLDFTELHPHPLIPGDELCIENQTWDCVQPCIIIGHIRDEFVLQLPGGPKINSQHLVKQGVLRTKGRPGQLPVEVMELGAYECTAFISLEGKTIKSVRRSCDSITIVCNDNTYCKFEIESGFAGPELESARLTIHDLFGMSLISETTMKIYQQQLEQRSKDGRQRDARQYLKKAISHLGVEGVKSLIAAEKVD